MKVVRTENNAFFDVDDTLIMTSQGIMTDYNMDIDYVCVEVVDPLSKKILLYRVNEPMVRLLTEEHHRGSTVIVWSRGGYAWAEAVVKALGLQDKVSLVMSKPLAYFDDKEVNEWLRYRVYISPDVAYKNK